MPSRKDKNISTHRIGFFGSVRSFIEQYNEDSTSMLANGMVYSTLLAIVPCLAVIYSVLNVLNVLDPVIEVAKAYVIETFGDSAGVTLVSYLDRFTGNAMSMDIISILSFSVTFILLINKIFIVVNRIYHTSISGNIVIRYLRYAGIILAGILAIAIGVYLVGTFSNLSQKVFQIPKLSIAEEILKRLLPITLIYALMLLMILFIPNCKVRLRSALIGSAFSTVGLWILANVFKFVVRRSVKYSVIYGSLATLLFSFMFLSYFWHVVLAGIVMAYVHQSATKGVVYRI